MLRGESGKLREDVDRQLVQIRTLVHDNQRQLRQELQQLNSQATTMTKDWGNDITRLLGVCERNTQALDARLSALSEQSDKDTSVTPEFAVGDAETASLSLSRRLRRWRPESPRFL